MSISDVLDAIYVIALLITLGGLINLFVALCADIIYRRIQYRSIEKMLMRKTGLKP